MHKHAHNAAVTTAHSAQTRTQCSSDYSTQCTMLPTAHLHIFISEGLWIPSHHFCQLLTTTVKRPKLFLQPWLWKELMNHRRTFSIRSADIPAFSISSAVGSSRCRLGTSPSESDCLSATTLHSLAICRQLLYSNSADNCCTQTVHR